MIAPNPHDPPSDEKPCPFDLGLTIDDWATEDPDGFDLAVEEAFADCWHSTIVDLIVERSTYHHTANVQGLEKVMNGRLEQVVASNPTWVQDWMRERTEGIEEE